MCLSRFIRFHMPEQAKICMDATAKNGRLLSLDILRGLDLFLLVFLQPVLISVLSHYDSSWARAILYQLDHEVWEGFRFWDLIMPLFLFMAGASMPFAFSKYKNAEGRKKAYSHVVKRFFILFFLGMVVQGNLLAFSWPDLRIYVNTLQAIAAGYLMSAIIILEFNRRGQLVMTLILQLAYSIPMSIHGDFSPEGNLANLIDAAVLAGFRGDSSYTWILSSLTFAVSVMLGVFAGQIIREGRNNPRFVTKKLFLIGVALIAVAFGWSFETPVIKRIWTGSMTLLSGGYCFILMGLFYYWIDCRKHIRGFDWLRIYGMNAITAYILGEIISFRSIVHSLTWGIEAYVGEEWYGTLLTFGNFLVLFFILKFMYRYRIFLKI